MKLKNNIRLGNNVIPIKYEINLKPDLANFTFTGIETIILSIKKNTKILTLHSKEIDIETVSVLFNREKIFSNKISYNENKETVSFNFIKNIPVGKCEITLVFSGILNDKMRGFYRSKYNIGTIEYNIATTQFEATDARRAFPCFDEPAHKAVFNVSLIVPKGKTAISNTLPISRMEHEAGYEIVKFSPTPKMSTYLVAFIVGDFEYIEKKSNKGVIVRIYTTPGKKHQAKFALDTTVNILEFYEKYFDIPYPLNTLDMIAIPDFASLAMENWGAITFREIGLLVDEKHSSINSKQMVAGVIAHELAHQWFGNLVTMEWWTHLWLNEGFATYIGNFAQAELYPKDDVWNQFVSGVSGHGLGNALHLDSLLSTHPVEILVHHPDEIGEVFDTISYDKGASVIRMLASYLGPKDFRDGLRYYLKKHSYKNTSTVHLWQAFEKVSRKPVTRIMDNWISKPGYPIVKTEIKEKNLVVSQDRFFSSLKSKDRNKDTTIWQIPISIGGQINEEILLDKSQKLIYIENLKDNSWLKLNIGETSIFRTAYSKELLNQLVKPVQQKILPASDRLGIVRDLFALSEAGITPTTDVLEFLSAYKDEDEYVVWTEIANGIGQLKQLLVKKNLTEELDKFILSLFNPLFKKLGWNKKKNEPDSTTLLRSLTLLMLGRAGDKKIISEAKRKFTVIKSGKYIDADIRGVVYVIVATIGRMKEYESFIKLYKKENLHEEKNRIGNALGSFRDVNILKKVCNFSITKDVRPQDAFFIFSYVGRNLLGRDIWLNFIEKNWKTLLSLYGNGGHALSSIVKAISNSSEKKHLEKFKKFFKIHDAPGAGRAIEQVIEKLENNITWLARDEKSIEKFLKNLK